MGNNGFIHHEISVWGLLKQMPTAIAIFDTEMRYMVATDKWITDYHLAGLDIIGKSHYEIFPEITEEWKLIHQECLKGSIRRRQEDSSLRADGSIQWISWEVKPWYKDDDSLGGLIMFTNEITEQKIKALESIKLQEIFQRISHTARIGAWEVDLNLQKVYWSKMTKQIHEVPDNYIPNFDEALHFYKEGASRDVILAAVNNAINFGTPFDLEVELVTNEKNTLWVRAVGEAEFITGKCVKFFGVFQDINKTKLQEIQISKLLAEQNSIFSSASEVAIITTNLSGEITHFNKGAENILGYSESEVLGQDSTQLYHKSEELLSFSLTLTNLLGEMVQERDVLRRIAQSNILNNREWTFIKKDGSKVPVQLSITQIKDINEETIGFLYTATNLSQIAEIKEQLLETNRNLNSITKTLSKQNWQLSNFAQVVSHNLRSPVANLILLQSLLKESEDIEEKEFLLSNFGVVTNHLSETLNTLTETIKIQEMAKENLASVRFDEVLKKTKEILIGQMLDEQLEITSNFEQCESVPFKVDFMESIFLNMLTNAMKYKSPNRKPLLDIRSEVLEDGRIALHFSDNGLGIDLKSYGTKVFGLNKTFHNHPEAKGIGLFIVRNQIESLGGLISVDSEVNVGTIFTITF